MAVWAQVLAHQGGWDEVAILAAPLLVFVALRVASSRRQRARQRSDDAAPGAESG